MPTVGKWQRDFLGILFSSILLNGKMNYSSLARHRELDEKTYRRGLRREFDFASFNFHGVAQRAEQGDLVAARDASFIAKSGKKTCGLGKFYSGCVGKTVKGLELSDLALSDRSRHQAFSFSTQQTVDELGKTRLALYAEQVTACAANLPEEVEYLLVDGYSKKHFVDSVGALERDLKRGGQLRCDANLRYFYRGAYSGKGGPKRYDGKVDFGDLSRFIYEGEAHKDVHLYAQTL